MKWLNSFGIRLIFIWIVIIVFLGTASICSAVEYVWTQKANMPTPRWSHTSAVVNGKIYIIGGSASEPNWKCLSTVEEYDPITDTWTRKADMPTARGWISPSSAVVDGKIYVIGGSDDIIWDLPIVEEYDPLTDTWTRKADMPTPRWCLATVAHEGKIYAIGGGPSDYDALDIVEVYDPSIDTWTRKADMPTDVYMLCANVVNGKIYCVGGRPFYTAIDYVQEYDPATDIWTRKSNMPLATSQMASIVLDGKIIVFGGWHWSLNDPYRTVQMYDPETDIWTQETDVPFGRACFTAEVVNNRIYVIGGTDRPHPCPALSTVYEFGPHVDFYDDGVIDIEDLLILIEHWGTNDLLCDIAPLPFGDGIVDILDLELFMSYWGQEINDPTLMAHFKLDETEGTIAYDSTGNQNNASVFGDAIWQPAGGIIDGAIELDGIDDYLATSSVMSQINIPFSIFAWIKGGAPGQVIISQANETNWLMADPLEGKLMMEIISSRGLITLVSDVVVTDGDWHRIGLCWDEYDKILYVDDMEVASTRTSTEISTDVLNIGADKNLQSSSFFSGLIDDLRIYNRAIIP